MIMVLKKRLFPAFLFLVFLGMNSCKKNSVAIHNVVTYDTVRIGNQTWMKYNLNVTTYRNGDAIPDVLEPELWQILTTGAYCDYNNIADTGKIYGHLYNWYAVNDSRNLAPEGWHVASDSEWTVLTSYPGVNLKERGTQHWYPPNTGANDNNGFTALPGGSRNFDGPFPVDSLTGIGYDGSWWTSTSVDSANAYYRGMRYNVTDAFRGTANKNYAFSVRCVKDK